VGYNNVHLIDKIILANYLDILIEQIVIIAIFKAIKLTVLQTNTLVRGDDITSQKKTRRQILPYPNNNKANWCTYMYFFFYVNTN